MGQRPSGARIHDAARPADSTRGGTCAPAPTPVSTGDRPQRRRRASAGAARRGASRCTAGHRPAPTPAQPRLPRHARACAAGRAPAPSTAARRRVPRSPGDTLTRIAARTQRAGRSLDQMLVALCAHNPQAFIDNNMNRLKAGVRAHACLRRQTAKETSVGRRASRSSRPRAPISPPTASGWPAACPPARPASRRARPPARCRPRSTTEGRPRPPAPDKLDAVARRVEGSAPEAKVSKDTETKERRRAWPS